MSSNFLVWHDSCGNLSRPEAFLFLNFVSTTSSSSLVKCPNIKLSWSLIIFVIGLSVTSDDPDSNQTKETIASKTSTVASKTQRQNFKT